MLCFLFLFHHLKMLSLSQESKCFLGVSDKIIFLKTLKIIKKLTFLFIKGHLGH